MDAAADRSIEALRDRMRTAFEEWNRDWPDLQWGLGYVASDPAAPEKGLQMAISGGGRASASLQLALEIAEWFIGRARANGAPKSGIDELLREMTERMLVANA